MRPFFARLLRDDRMPGAAAALTAFCVYLTTLAPSIGWEEDSGELAAAFATLGIPHPSGYPLFTPLAWVFSRLPLGGTAVWRLNLLVALLCAAAVYLVYRLFLFILSGEGRALFRIGASTALRGKGKARDRESADSGPAGIRWAAAGAALVLAFSKTFWSEAVSIEVYAFHLVLTAAVLLLFLRSMAVQAKNPDAPAGWRWQAFALALGLSAAHHLMTVMLAPALLVLFFAVNGFGSAAWRRIAGAAPMFLAGLSAYLYLPLRAAAGPVMNWGDPSSPGRLWFHVTGAQYRYKMFTSAGGAADKLADFAAAWPREFGYAPMALALIGLAASFRASRRLFAFSLLLFLGSLLFALNYTFNDPNFYLNAHLATALWIALGMAALLRAARAASAVRIAGAACVLLAAVPLAMNHRLVDQRGNHAVEEYARNVLASVDSGGAVLTGQYALFTAPAYYLQLVEGVRSDVLILDTQLLKFPWYYAQLGRRWPWLIRDCRPEVEAFLAANARFEAEAVPDSAAFVRRTLSEYQAVVRALVRRAARERPVFATSEVIIPPEWGYQKTPAGLAFRLSEGDVAHYPARIFTFRALPENASGSAAIRSYYAIGYLNQAIYHGLVRGDTLTGTDLLRRSVAAKPDFWPARRLLMQVTAGK